MNVMRKPEIYRVVLSAGATGPELLKAQKLLNVLSGRNAHIIRAGPKRRIPELGVKPDMELGTRVTLRGKDALNLLKRLLGAIDNIVSRSSVQENHFSFGIPEYIEIPDMEYIRDIGIRGFNVTVVFERPGVRVKRRKIKSSKLPKRQHVAPGEIIQYMEDTFKTKFE